MGIRMLFFLLPPFLIAQKNEVQFKVNTITLPLAIVNFGLEYSLNNNTTIQAEGFISPWKSFANNHFQMYIGYIEGRYYFDESFSKFYIGPHVGVGFFDLQKWNYWNTNKFQRGVTLLTGITLGYQTNINDNFGFDIFIGGGHSQGNYHGYYKNGARYEKATNFNKSGEWLLYKGGVMFTYKLKRSTN